MGRMPAEAAAAGGGSPECRQRLSLLELAFDNIANALCMFDSQGRVVVCNRRYSEILGLPAEAVRPGASIRELVEMRMRTGAHYSGRNADEVASDLWAFLNSDGQTGLHLEHDGRTFEVRPHRAATGHVVATFLDISERLKTKSVLQESHERLSAILDAMPDCVKIFDETARLIYINPRGLELLQAPDLEALTQSGHTPVPPEYLAECIEVHNRVLAGETVVWSYEILGMRGGRRHVEAHAVPFRMPDGAKAHMCISRDIGARQAAEDALRRSEERLRLVHEATGLAHFEAGGDGVAHFSPGLLRQFGLPEDAPTAMRFEDWIHLVHPDDRDRLTAVEKSLSTSDSAHCEFRIIRADTGEVRWISSNLQLHRDGCGKMVRSIGAHLDITDRKRAEEGLRESEARMRAILDAMPDCVKIFDERAELTYINPRGLQLLEAPDLTAIAESRHLSVPAEYMEECVDVHRRVIDGETVVWNYEVLGLRGARHHVEAHAVPFRLPGGAKAHMSISRDISERMEAENALRRSEQRLRLVQDATGMADFETGPDGLMLACERFYEQLGIPVPDGPVDSKSWARQIHPADLASVVDQIEGAIARREEGFQGEFRIVRGDTGEVRWISCSTSMQFDDHGKLIRTIGAHLDITDRKRGEEALRASEERLRLVQETTGLADFETDSTGVSICSDRFFEQCGLPVPAEGVIAFGDWLGIVHPEDREELAAKVTIAVKDRDEFGHQFRIVRADTGETRWIASRTRVERDEAGNPLRSIGAHLDITEHKRAEQALRESEQRLRLVQEATGLADFEAGPDGLADVSEAMIRQLGLPPGTVTLPLEEMLGYVHPEDRKHLQSEIRRSLETQDTFECEFRIVHGVTGEVRWIHSRTKMERDAAGLAIRSIGAHLDITERKHAEEALRESEERFRLAAEAAGFGVWDYNEELDRREWSDRLREIFGTSDEALTLAETADRCFHPADRERFIALARDVRSGKIDRFEEPFRIKRISDGRERWVAINAWRTLKADRQARRIIMTVRDVTDEKTAEERIRWSASHDPLTRLANRALFQEQLDQAIRRAKAGSKSVGVLMLDLDHFKQINDSLGHDVGDGLLKLFAERLRSVVRSRDTVARLGGDEFAIVVPDLQSEDQLVRLSQSIQERMRAPFVHAGRMLDCRASLGASMYPAHGNASREVLKNADVALYAAKAAGRATLMMYDAELRTEMQRRLAMIHLARSAISDDRVIPYYQPKLDLQSGAVDGFEALLRWRMPNGRIAQPASIEAAFEDLEVAAALSDRMIDRVIADMRGWLDRGIAFKHVAVNASAAEFRRDNFAERVLEQLARAQIPTRCFQIEVTETVFLGRGAEYVHRALALLNAQGVKIALDDFGTGYASLRHLKQFPVDIIKIDRSFVRDMEVDPGDEAIVRAVINLGKSLGIRVVAEGIESEAQARHLMRLGCDFGQGFLFSKAVGANRLPALVGNLGKVPSPQREVSSRGELRVVGGNG